ncbi:hypothetical protein E2L07_20105 [Halalkalibacterium halodurans]|uniref:cupredoxin domain-containing protein n=1 Tax=Halalkalibacterium halodurans TaxID=86665 RepID=UPI001067786F|nr:cupredoxin domain-containing protein [Halalkalibacterium halodurans]TES45870.1 hypothetical protein E2L07_20105 [Halalkalibacterium halodurans]
MIQSTMLSVVFILLLSWLIIFAYMYREKLSHMVGMVISMTVGMIVGISVGTLSAILYPESFFEVTIISMLIGGLIGVIAGYPFSLTAILDGLMSGIMGGMMGTMLGLMVPPENQNQLLNIISLLTVGVFFLVYLLQVSEINKVGKRSTSLFQPLPYFLVVCFFIFSFHGYSFEVSNGSSLHSSHSENRVVMIDAGEYQFTPGQIQVSQNEEITFTLTNNGSEEHDFEIKGLDYHLHALPGGSDSLSFTFTEPGTYQAVCTIPGHKEAGMIATVMVTESE